MVPTHNYLIIQALGHNRAEIMHELVRACTHCGCNILHSKVTVLGSELSIMLFLAGNWGAIAKLEATLPSLEQKLGLSLFSRRTREYTPPGQSMAYSIQITAIDKPGILGGIIDFFYHAHIPTEEISAHTYFTQVGTRMAALQLKIQIPDKVHLATLREQFLNYCDDHNLDALLEPFRGLS